MSPSFKTIYTEKNYDKEELPQWRELSQNYPSNTICSWLYPVNNKKILSFSTGKKYAFIYKRLPKYEQMLLCLHNCNIICEGGISECDESHIFQGCFLAWLQALKLSGLFASSTYFHSTECTLDYEMWYNLSPVTLHERDKSVHVLIHGENRDTIAAKSFLPQKRRSFIHGSQGSLVQQLLKMQRKAWEKSPVNSERQTASASIP